jgi:hypothetical protein
MHSYRKQTDIFSSNKYISLAMVLGNRPWVSVYSTLGCVGNKPTEVNISLRPEHSDFTPGVIRHLTQMSREYRVAEETLYLS